MVSAMPDRKFVVGRITLSDRAAAGVYEDASGPEIERVLREFFEEEMEFRACVLPDQRDQIEQALRDFIAAEIPLIVTTGGTGPSARDVTPEATRAVAGVAGHSLIINLPGRPTAIAECLALIAPAIAECLDHVAGWRPKLAADKNSR